MNVLVADDEKIIRVSLTELLEGEGFKVFQASNGNEVFNALQRERIHAAIVDYQMPGMNGLEILNRIKMEFSSVEVIMITAFGNENIAISAIRNGAFDYISKPFNNDELVNRLRHIEKIIKNEESDIDDCLFLSPEMKKIIETVKSISHADVPVLITGESGTGKEIIARLVHHYSNRKGKFVAINCSAIPLTLMESELFGAVKGSYTGASSDRPGHFREADRGTLFLDEIGDMALDMQAKLLRAVQEGMILSVGTSEPVKVDVRIVAATNRDIEADVAERKFREDLYYRINVIRITMPSLKERRDEIIPLANLFLRKFSDKYKKNIEGFSDEILEIMLSYNWPGNIRELQNRIEKWVLLSKDHIISTDVCDIDNNTQGGINQSKKKSGGLSRGINADPVFDFNVLPRDFSTAKKIINENFEKKFILYHLNDNNNNITKTAEATGIFRQHLHTKIKKHKIKKIEKNDLQ